MFKAVCTGALLGAGLAVSVSGAASAAVIGGPHVFFDGASISIGYNKSNDFTFTDVSHGAFTFDSVAVTTSGGGQVSVFFGSPTTYQDPRGGFNAQTFGAGIPLLNFAAIPSITTISGSATREIIGLLDVVGGEAHYGYAELSGPQLLSYAFEGTPGASIVPGVPLPASAPMFGAALLAFGAVSYGLKRKRAAVG